MQRNCPQSLSLTTSQSGFRFLVEGILKVVVIHIQTALKPADGFAALLLSFVDQTGLQSGPGSKIFGAIGPQTDGLRIIIERLIGIGIILKKTGGPVTEFHLIGGRCEVGGLMAM